MEVMGLSREWELRVAEVEVPGKYSRMAGH